MWAGDPDPRVETTFRQTAQYRVFSPPVCQMPFATDQVRIKLDTVAVTDWNEIDYLLVGGSRTAPASYFDANATVAYVPWGAFCGTDEASFRVYDCGLDATRAAHDCILNKTASIRSFGE